MRRTARIGLDASTVCQLYCPLCTNHIKELADRVGHGFLSFTDFRRLIDANPAIRDIELANWGEVFLNPDLKHILRHAWERGIRLRVDNGANLNSVPEETLEALVRYRLRSLTCSIDGATPRTYGMYRVRGSFEAVLGNIRRINDYKRALRSSSPVLTWQFIVFGHNQHEIQQARALARELRMRFRTKLSWNESFSPVTDPALVKRQTGSRWTSRREYQASRRRDFMHGACHQLWERPQINWDGRLLGCCANLWADYGVNVLEEGLRAALDCERYRYAKRMVQGRAPERGDVPCVRCTIYRQMAAEGVWIRRGVRRRLHLLLRSVYPLVRTLPGIDRLKERVRQTI